MLLLLLVSTLASAPPPSPSSRSAARTRRQAHAPRSLSMPPPPPPGDLGPRLAAALAPAFMRMCACGSVRRRREAILNHASIASIISIRSPIINPNCSKRRVCRHLHSRAPGGKLCHGSINHRPIDAGVPACAPDLPGVVWEHTTSREKRRGGGFHRRRASSGDVAVMCRVHRFGVHRKPSTRAPEASSFRPRPLGCVCLDRSIHSNPLIQPTHNIPTHRGLAERGCCSAVQSVHQRCSHRLRATASCLLLSFTPPCCCARLHAVATYSRGC